MTDFRLVEAGDACLMVVFEERIDPAVNARCVALAEVVRARAFAEVRDVVPTYHTVAIHFDPRRVDLERLVKEIEQEAARVRAVAEPARAPIEVPVCYGGEFGPDLSNVARFAGCSEDEVVRLHAAVVYRVYMLGFLPGFAYMGPVPARIAAPRLPTPRLRVSTGSVGIAGAQTGIYPIDTPGGWQVIGRAAMKPFDPARDVPFLFKSADRVKFLPISAHAFRDSLSA